jgi:hypothetical protein
MSKLLRTIVSPDDLRDIKNTSGATLRKGTFVKVKTSPTVEDEAAPCSAGTDPIYGVVYGRDIPDGDYGTAQIGGKAAVFAGGSVAVGANVTSDASGDGVTAVAGNVIAGIAMTTGVDGAFFEVELRLPGSRVPT